MLHRSMWECSRMQTPYAESRMCTHARMHVETAAHSHLSPGTLPHHASCRSQLLPKAHFGRSGVRAEIKTGGRIKTSPILPLPTMDPCQIRRWCDNTDLLPDLRAPTHLPSPSSCPAPAKQERLSLASNT